MWNRMTAKDHKAEFVAHHDDKPPRPPGYIDTLATSMFGALLHRRAPPPLPSKSKVDPRFWLRNSQSSYHHPRTSTRSRREDQSRREAMRSYREGMNQKVGNPLQPLPKKLSIKRSSSARQLPTSLASRRLRQTFVSARNLKIAANDKNEAPEVVTNYVYEVPEKKVKGKLHEDDSDDFDDEDDEEEDDFSVDMRPFISEDDDEIAYFAHRLGGADFKLLRRHVLHPHGRIRAIWDTLTLVLLTWVLIIVPFELTFTMRDSLRRGILRLDLTVDTFFFLDIVLNFMTAVEDDGKLHFSFLAIARHYTSGWFVPEVLWTIPFYAIFEGHDPQVYGAAITSLFTFFQETAWAYPAARCLRLLRVVGLPRLQHRLEHSLLISSKVSSLGSFLFIVLALSHVFSCVFAYLAFHDDDQLEFALTTRMLQDSEVKSRYIAAFYWSMMTMTTVGYGDITVKTNAGRLFSIAAMIVGAGVFAYGITNVVSLFQQLYEKDTAYRRDMDQVNDFMQARMLPRALRDKVRANTFHWRKAARGETKERDRAIVARMARLVRAKVADRFCEAMMPHKMPFLAGCSAEFIHDLYLRMRVQCYLPGEDIICQGDYGSEMFFLFVGHAQVLLGLTKVALFGPNSCFGEFSIANPRKPRLATIQALEFCETHCIDREQILRVLLSHPITMRSARQLATLRSRKALTLIYESGGKSRTLLQGLALMWRAEGVEALLPAGVSSAALPFLQEFTAVPSNGARPNGGGALVQSSGGNPHVQPHYLATQHHLEPPLHSKDTLQPILSPSFSKATNSGPTRRLSLAVTPFPTSPSLLSSHSQYRGRSRIPDSLKTSSETTTSDRIGGNREASYSLSRSYSKSTLRRGASGNLLVESPGSTASKQDDRLDVLLMEIRNVARRQDLLEQQLKTMIERQQPTPASFLPSLDEVAESNEPGHYESSPVRSFFKGYA